MNLAHPERSDRLDALAAAYALGTLGPRARRRLARLSQRNPEIASALRKWEWRFAALSEGSPEVNPSPIVWERIRTRLGLADPGPGRAGAPANVPWRTSLALWRGLAVAGFALAFALGISMLAPRERPFEGVVVVLAGPDAKPTLIATGERRSRFLTVKAVTDVAIARDRALELWMLPEGAPPRSLGLVPASGVDRVALSAPLGVALQNVPALAVSLEPAGGSTTGAPTGPVLYTGRVERTY